MDLERSRVLGQKGNVITMAAAGVYDSEKQLTSEQIIELKDRLRVDHGLRVKVCGHLALTLMEPHYVYTDESLGEDEERKLFQSTVSYAGATGASIAILLEEALALDDGEWPEYITPPATFAEAIKELEAMRPVRGSVDG